MPYLNLQEYMISLEKRNQLRRISTGVSRDYEITAVGGRTRQKAGQNPALLFENVTDYEFPVLVNVFSSVERVSWGFGLTGLNLLSERINSLLKPDLPQKLGDKLRRLTELPDVLKFSPQLLKNAPCHEVINARNPSFQLLPLLKSFPDEAGRSLNRALLIMQDEAGKKSCTAARLQISGERTATVVETAEPLNLSGRQEAALVIGDDPALLLTCASGVSLTNAPGLAELDNLTLAGYLRRTRFEVARGHSVGIEVPANAEFVLEGFIEPGGKSGQVAQPSGYYGTVSAAPVFTLTAITHRKQPIYTDIIPGVPPQEEAFIAKVRERLLLPLLQSIAPEVCDINLMPGNSANSMILVSIKKSYPGQAQKVMFALWGMAALQEVKYLVVLDSDCNVQDLRESLWRATWNTNPQRDFNIVSGTLSPLELNNLTPGFGSKLGIDATRKLPGELHPQSSTLKATIPEEVLRLVEEKWSNYGID